MFYVEYMMFYVLGGLLGIFEKYRAYQRWVRTISSRAKLFEEMCDMIDEPECPKSGKNCDLEASQIKKSECAIKKVMEAISHFKNPLKISDKERLYCLSSGAPIPQEIEVDILHADVLGKTFKGTFIQERLIHGHEKDLFDPVARQKLKTMNNPNKTVCLRTSQESLIQYKEQCDLAFKLLVKSQMLNVPIDLDYPLSPVPHCLGTHDGFFAKTNKASMLHFIMEGHDVEEQYLKGSMFIQDGNVLFHTLNNLPPTVGGICLQFLDHMAAKQNFIFSADSYHQDSIKSQERVRRGCREKLILQRSATRKPKDFKAFLTNDENKRQLCEVLL